MSEMLKITEVEHYTDRLFRIRTEKPNDFTFRAGEFTMIGMGDNDLMRAYSITSAPGDPFLEFYSIKVPDGPLTSRLQHVQPGDTIEVGDRPTGSLTTQFVQPGHDLWLMATGTGIAPFISLLRDGEIFNIYKRVHVTWTVRTPAELLSYHEFLQNLDIDYFPTVTQEEFVNTGRIQRHIESGAIMTNSKPETDRVMLCGSMAFNQDMKNLLVSNGYTEGNKKNPGTFVLERAFVT